MPKIEASTVEKYQLILEKDPSSQVFAPLAEAYREMGMLKEALQVVTAGVQRHPQFPSGLVTSARILRDLGENEKALSALKKAIALSPENLLAHHLMADIYVRTKNPKEALKAYKMVLFLNPQSQSAQKAVSKLESLTADEYDDEVFSMTKLPDVNLDAPAPTSLQPRDLSDKTFVPQKSVPQVKVSPSKAMERMLSLIDAFIVRNDLEKAHTLLRDTEIEFGKHPEIQRRLQSLQVRYSDTDEVAAPIKPLAPRDQRIQQKKLDTLEMMLRRIEDYRSQG